MNNVAFRFIINIAFLRTPFRFVQRNGSLNSTAKELIEMFRDFKILWALSLFFSIVLSGYLYWYYQLPVLWCVVLFFYNSQILPTFYCFFYRYKGINYSVYFNDKYTLIREQFKRSIDSVTSWFLTCLLPINIFNNYLYGGSRWESLIDIFFSIYVFVAFVLYFLRYYSFKKFL